MHRIQPYFSFLSFCPPPERLVPHLFPLSRASHTHHATVSRASIQPPERKVIPAAPTRDEEMTVPCLAIVGVPPQMGEWKALAERHIASAVHRACGVRTDPTRVFIHPAETIDGERTATVYLTDDAFEQAQDSNRAKNGIFDIVFKRRPWLQDPDDEGYIASGVLAHKRPVADLPPLPRGGPRYSEMHSVSKSAALSSSTSQWHSSSQRPAPTRATPGGAVSAVEQPTLPPVPPPITRVLDLIEPIEFSVKVVRSTLLSFSAMNPAEYLQFDGRTLRFWKSRSDFDARTEP